MGTKILIADDDYLLRDLLRDILEKENYEVAEAENGTEVLRYLEQNKDTDLVLLDIMMPGMDGTEVLREIRKKNSLPVIMLTALGDSASELENLRLGACDYITKPFHVEILIERIRTVLRYKQEHSTEEEHTWTEGELEVNPKSCQVKVAGEKVLLTNKEYQLLVYLMRNRNIVLTREQMLEQIWGFDYEGDIRTTDTHIKMLRLDLGCCGSYIKTVRGIGYVFRPEEDV